MWPFSSVWNSIERSLGWQPKLRQRMLLTNHRQQQRPWIWCSTLMNQSNSNNKLMDKKKEEERKEARQLLRVAAGLCLWSLDSWTEVTAHCSDNYLSIHTFYKIFLSWFLNNTTKQALCCFQLIILVCSWIKMFWFFWEPKQFWYNAIQSPCNNNFARVITTGVNLFFHGLAREQQNWVCCYCTGTENILSSSEKNNSFPQKGKLKWTFGVPPCYFHWPSSVKKQATR